MPGHKKQQSIRFDEELVEEFRGLSPGHKGLSVAAIFDFALRVTIDAMSAKPATRPPTCDEAQGGAQSFPDDDDLGIGL